jgi:hypothetical protein
MSKPETLVAIDWSGENLAIDRVLAFVGDALIAHEVTTQPHAGTNATADSPRQTVHRVTFDSRQVRNTEVHGAGYRSGFLVNIETP